MYPDNVRISFFQDEERFLVAGETAGPSTALRSGRDDNSVAAGIDMTESMSAPCNKLVIPTGAYPDFLLRAASNEQMCGSPLELTTGFADPRGDETGLCLRFFLQTNSVWVPHVRTSVRGLAKTGKAPSKVRLFLFCRHHS